MTGDITQDGQIRLLSLPQLAPLGRWQLELPHDRGEHLLLWLTRGQGVALFDGARTGIGTNNAIFVPSRHLLALDLGGQCFGQALVIPAEFDLPLPARPVHLRLRDVATQKDLAGLFEAIGREQSAAAPFHGDAMRAYCDLVAIWLQRAMAVAPAPLRPAAAKRLSRAYFDRLVRAHATGASMAEHAAELNVTPTHLTRVCKAQTGRTAAALLTGRVLHAVREKLALSRRPASHIARDLGFGSAAYFTRFVQQHTGETPSKLRKSKA